MTNGQQPGAYQPGDGSEADALFGKLVGPQPDEVEIDYSMLDTTKLENGKHTWTWTSPGGAAYQGPKHYARAADALKAGRRWLETEGFKQR